MVNYSKLETSPRTHLYPMNTLDSTPWPEVQAGFELHHHGKILVRECTNWFGFQISASNPVPHPSLYFTLHQEPSTPNPVQFGVRVDLETGEIWDIANKCGVIGCLEQGLWPKSDDPYPITLRWEVEHTGSVLIPRLHIGDEEWLYPSLLFPGESHFVATTGHNLEGSSTSALFSPGYVWCQDRLP